MKHIAAFLTACLTASLLLFRVPRPHLRLNAGLFPPAPTIVLRHRVFIIPGSVCPSVSIYGYQFCSFRCAGKASNPSFHRQSFLPRPLGRLDLTQGHSQLTAGNLVYTGSEKGFSPVLSASSFAGILSRFSETPHHP